MKRTDIMKKTAIGIRGKYLPEIPGWIMWGTQADLVRGVVGNALGGTMAITTATVWEHQARENGYEDEYL